MRKIILSVIGIAFSVVSIGQLKFKGSLLPGPAASSVDIVIMPTADFTGYLTNVVFVLQIPQSVIQPEISATSLSSYFTDFDRLPADTSNGYINYGFKALNTAVTTNTAINSGVNYSVLRLSFSDGALAATDIRLAHLPNGGTSTLYQFYVEANSTEGANDYTNYAQMFFGGGTFPATPYNDEGAGYSNYQYVTLSTVLPLKLTGFTAIKKDQDAFLTWMIQNQDANASHFEIERSLNGVNFTYAGRVELNLNNGSSGAYSFTDTDVALATSKGLVFYRIKSVDKDGKVLYSEVRNIKINGKGFEVSLSPNPARTHTIATIDLEQAAPILINITDVSGKKLQQVKLGGVKGANTKKLDLSGLAAGSYLLKVFSGEQSQTVPLVKAE